jgi:hypothetical protein
MKIQDIAFLLYFAFLLYKRSPQLSAISGLVLLIFSIPLFAAWIFFTAERLTWYAAACLLLSFGLSMIKLRKI